MNQRASKGSIVLYTGYHRIPWSGQSFMGKGLGGSETALLNLGLQLLKHDYTVTICGSVENSTWRDIQFLNLDTMHSVLDKNGVDIIIATHYIHYLLEFSEYNYKQSYFWIHNTDFYDNWRKEKLLNADTEWINHEKITNIICVSEWHKAAILKNYPHINSNSIRVIGNAIEPSYFPSNTVKKVPRKFIYSSGPERGLLELSELWPRILRRYPDAKLTLCTPVYTSQTFDQIKEYAQDILPNTEFKGALGQAELYKEISASSYWLYPSYYDETYCITALEMQYGKVAIISSKRAALNETVADRGILIDQENITTDTFLNQCLEKLELLESASHMKNAMLEKAHNWATQQTWELRCQEWLNLLEEK